MRAHELTEYESGTDNSAQIFAKLKSLGYERLGSGQDATVWSKDENSVIKILMPSDKPHQAENGFITFYDFCQQHKDLPNLPKFVDIGGAHHTVFEINGQPYRQIAMERLVPIKGLEERMVWMLSDFANTRANWDQTKVKITELDQDIGKMFSDPKFNADYALLFSTMQVLCLIGKSNGLGWDLHTENVMQRRDGTLVIVDPFYS